MSWSPGSFKYWGRKTIYTKCQKTSIIILLNILVNTQPILIFLITKSTVLCVYKVYKFFTLPVKVMDVFETRCILKLYKNCSKIGLFTCNCAWTCREIRLMYNDYCWQDLRIAWSWLCRWFIFSLTTDYNKF